MTITRSGPLAMAAAGLAGATLAGLRSQGLRRDLARLRRHTVDAVTGTPIRGLWEAEAINRIHACPRSVSLAIVDLDHFKIINDTLGHLVGDQVLRAVAEHLYGAVQPRSVLITRLGGDEFGVLTTGTPLRKSDLRPDAPISVSHAPEPIDVSASVGVVRCATLAPPPDLSRSLAAADADLYRDKGRSARFDSI